MILLLFLVRKRLFTISQQVLSRAARVDNVTLEDQSHSFVIVPKKNRQKETAIIFYPGALVDARAYVPKLAGIANSRGIKVFIVKPYLRLADLNPNAASGIIKANPHIRTWYLGGHSMGGGAACNFSSHNPSLVHGLFLLAAYCGPKNRQFSGPTLVLVGTHDLLEPISKIQSRIPSKAVIIKIEGANHASFSNYGSQPLDGKQTISDTDMTMALTEALKSFIKK